MSLLRKFFKEIAKSPDVKGGSDGGSPVDAPTSAHDSPEHAEDAETRARQFYDEAEALYKKGNYAEAAGQYRAAYQLMKSGVLAFNVAQAYRLAKNFPNAIVWYEKALALGGSEVNPYREEIEGRIAEMQGEMKKNPARGPGGEDLGEAQMVFEQAEIAYGEGDYATAIALYKRAYSVSKMPEMMFNVAQACRLGGQLADAKYWYREFLKKVPKTPYKEEIEGYIKELKKKVPDLPKDGDAASEYDAREAFEQAERLYKIGMFTEAATLYVEVYHDPAVADRRGMLAFNLGQCMRQTGKPASAVDWYEIALKELPDDNPYRAEIADWVKKLGGKEVAV